VIFVFNDPRDRLRNCVRGRSIVGSHFELFPNKSDIYILHLPPFKEMLDELEKFVSFSLRM
jgi:hypothetical protein